MQKQYTLPTTKEQKQHKNKKMKWTSFHSYFLRMKQLLLGLLLWLLVLHQTACVSSKSWKEDQFLLHGIRLEGNKSIPTYDIEPLYQQKPNRTIGIFLPYVWVYTIGEKFYKPKKIGLEIEKTRNQFAPKIRKAELNNRENKLRRLEKKERKKINQLNTKLKEGNWLMRAVGEAPVFYDSVRTYRTAQEITKYLQSKGFFQGTVGVKTEKVFQKRRKVTYQITEQQPTFFGDVSYVSSNPRIDSLLKSTKDKSNIVKDAPYNTSKISAEQQRIEQLLRNNGYLYFSRQYVTFSIDTLHFGLPPIDTLRTQLPDSLRQRSLTELTQDTTFTKLLNRHRTYNAYERKANLRVIINNPRQGNHQFYTVKDVFFHITNNQQKPAGDATDSEQLDTLASPYTGIKYVYDSKRLNYKYRIIDRRMRIKPEQIYRQDNVLTSQTSIGVLDVFKFVNFNPDTTQFNTLKFDIYTQPMERFQLSDEIGLDGIQGLPGPFVNITLKNRNTFEGAEIFENSLRLAIDGQTSFANQGSYSSQELAFNSSITFPRVLFPYRWLPRRLRSVIDLYNPTTKLKLSYNYIRRPEYTRTNLSGSISYKVQTRFSSYNFTLADLSVVNTQSISPEFNEQLELLTSQGNPITESFNRALVSNMGFIYTYNNNYGENVGRSTYFRILLEAGGTTLNLLKQTPLIEDNRVFGLRVFQYWRINPTFYYHLPLKKPEHSLAFRVNAGIAAPYGQSNTLPYEKFFFAGGNNGVRAWITRRLGPGASRPEVTPNGTFDYRFEAPGEILLEGNLEYRFPMVSALKGAFFIDAGNVWNLREQPNALGGKFQFNSFYKQIAIGTGFGVRFDLAFLLVRFDIGIKVYDPARLPDRRWVIGQFNPLKPRERGLALLNVGIGYPF